MDLLKEYFKVDISNLNLETSKKYIYYNEIKNKSGKRYNEAFKELDKYDTYSCSPISIFEIFDELSKYINDNSSILDIGSGRGLFTICYMNNIKHIGGIEVDINNVNITHENLKILGIDNKIQIYHCDILDFSDYDKYNIFYLYNPFDSHIFNMVIKKIKIGSIIIYLNVHDEEKKILHDNNFILIKSFNDRILNRECVIYKN